MQNLEMDQLASTEVSFDLGMTLAEISLQTTFEIATTSPKMVQLAGKIGALELEKLIVVIIKQFCDAMKVSNSMEALQIIECAKEYIATYPLNSVKDLVLCLRNAKKGLYGQVYNRLDQSVIFDFVSKYENERSQYFDNKRHNLKAGQQSDQLAVINALPEEIKAVVKTIGREQKLKRTPDLREISAFTTYEKFLADLDLALPIATEEQIKTLKEIARSKGLEEVLKSIADFEESLKTQTNEAS